MQIVMGGLNGVWLENLMSSSVGKASRVTAAVAYATQNCPFFEHCKNNGLPLTFYGLLDEDEAVSIELLQQMLNAGPLVVDPRLIKGYFHSKIIWWHGYGAYIGSANLTGHAWFSNVECGAFFDEDEIVGHQLQNDLESQFGYLRQCSYPVDSELLKALKNLRPHKSTVHDAKKKFASKFDEATKNIPNHKGLAAYGPATSETAFTQFTTEWSQTLQLLRGLSKEFKLLNLWPKWIPPTADPSVHFDQFLHAYYYVKIRDKLDDRESTKSIVRVERAYQQHKAHPAQALKDAANWWAALPEAPYDEDKFITDGAPFVQRKFELETLRSWTLTDFQEVFSHVHAFTTHARQMRNSIFELPQNHHESSQGRSDRLARWLWEQPRRADQKTILELLEFLVWGSSPASMVERLWMVVKDDRWRYDHLGPSTLGEAVGWARPDQFPPRNNRTNKALRALGHDVRLFSD